MSDIFIVKGLGGQRKLNGTVVITGAKNAALKAFAATVLFRDTVTLKNIPEIDDVRQITELLSNMGAKIEHPKTSEYKVFIPKDFSTELSSSIAKRLRASVVITGPVLARFGKVSFPSPGGCLIGARPINLFIEGFKRMGAKVDLKDSSYIISAPQGLCGAEIFLKNQSVTVTETFILAGVLAKGITTIKNASMEPEIVDLADFINKCGAKISGVGTPTIIIKGGKLLSAKGHSYQTMPDRIDTGSFLILGALVAKEIRITNCDPSHLESPIEMLRSAGVHIETKKNEIIVRAPLRINPLNIKTHEYPGFPTDLQAPMTVFLTQAEGESIVFETIFEGRLNYTEALTGMGANFVVMDPHRILVKGRSKLRGKELMSPDLRAGLAYLIAAIVAKGKSVVHNVNTTIDRGYEEIENRLRDIGVDIERISKGEETSSN